MRVLLCIIALSAAASAHAQDKRREHAPRTADQEKGKGKGKSETARQESREDASEAEQGAEIRKEGDAEVKVMEFSGLDIEGQLKTPQMLYFLNRLRAEFGRPRLPHRSFMPELQRSTKGKSF